MVKKSAIRSIGNSSGATIPKSILEKYNLHDGDEVFIQETENGILISPFNPEFEVAVEIYKMGSKKFRNAMKELAK